jgi:hypothetical protein
VLDHGYGNGPKLNLDLRAIFAFVVNPDLLLPAQGWDIL